MARKKHDAVAAKSFELNDTQKAELIARYAAHVGDFAVEMQNMSAELGLKQLKLEQAVLESLDRSVLQSLPGLPAKLQTVLSKSSEPLAVSDVTTLLLTLARTMLDGDPNQQLANVLVSSQLMTNLQVGMAESLLPPAVMQEGARSKPKPNVVFQFKITLLGSEPPIWRRIQVPDSTLHDLHYAIQDAMGWTDSHLHEFEIDGELYSSSDMEIDDFGESEALDSQDFLLSELMPTGKKKFRFMYTYDFGDGWEHEILYEGLSPMEKGKKYPLCVEGARACPPEDIGGVWGYEEYLQALANPQHERHAEFMEWSGEFDPERFDLAETTKAMQRGSSAS